MNIDNEFPFAPEGSFQMLQEELGKMIQILERIPGSAAVTSVYFPKIPTLDGFAGGSPERMRELFYDVTKRVAEELVRRLPLEEAKKAMTEEIEFAFTSDGPAQPAF